MIKKRSYQFLPLIDFYYASLLASALVFLALGLILLYLLFYNEEEEELEEEDEI